MHSSFPACPHSCLETIYSTTKSFWRNSLCKLDIFLISGLLCCFFHFPLCPLLVEHANSKVTVMSALKSISVTNVTLFLLTAASTFHSATSFPFYQSGNVISHTWLQCVFSITPPYTLPMLLILLQHFVFGCKNVI